MAAKTKAERIWALYKGDEFISVGTIDEIAKETGRSFDNLMFMTHPSYMKRKSAGNKLRLYEVDDDE
ncbi:hypothetical protein [Fructobacillus cardui]|uniref:Phage protein n=1 Tax=Fructobacillus cardui TaxID=2893170 RepID=A0ABN9YSW0_9LACO|nr:hypothetical protein R82641_BJNNKPBH_00865 [Fructobacillus cardui]